MGELLREECGERLDDLQCNGLYLIQDPDKFCFGIDAVLLSNFVKVKKNGHVVDLCTGSGIVPILLSAKTGAKKITGIEIQSDIADMARRSVSYNKLDEKIDEIMLLVVHGGEKETDNYLEMVFPLDVHLSKEKPILNIRFLIDEYFNLWISSSRYSKDKKIENVEFTSKKNMNNCNNILDKPIRIGHMLIFSDLLGIVEDDFKGNLTSTRNRCIIKV